MANSIAIKPICSLPSLHSVRALQYALHTSLKEMQTAYKELQAAMATLEGEPTQDLINTTVECCLRPLAEVLAK